MALDPDKLQDFLNRFVADLGATFAAGNVVVGHRLGLYQALAAGPATAAELAARTDTNARYVDEWLRGQAAGGYVEYDPAADRYSMTEEQAFALADPDGGVYAPGAFVLALGTLKAEPRITRAFRTGEGMGWHEQDADVFIGCEQFFRPGYVANLIPSWIPALDDVPGKLAAGARVIDIGCGLGASTILLATEYPSSSVTGCDYHDQSIELARKRAADAGVADRVRFEVASAATFSGVGYDLAATFDCLHDMGDPVTAARHVRQALAPDGTWLIVEPYAADDIAGNLNPVGRIYYSASTQLCVPNALSQPGGFALGAQAGETAIRQVVTDAGFTRFRRAAETPFNLVYEVRPLAVRQPRRRDSQQATSLSVSRAVPAGGDAAALSPWAGFLRPGRGRPADGRSVGGMRGDVLLLRAPALPAPRWIPRYPVRPLPRVRPEPGLLAGLVVAGRYPSAREPPCWARGLCLACVSGLLARAWLSFLARAWAGPARCPRSPRAGQRQARPPLPSRRCAARAR